MTIAQLASRLNQKARSGHHAFAGLPELRKQYLSKKQLPADIFSAKTIFDGPDKYIFHYGGRDEMQFNVGADHLGGKDVTRFALCFSLEPSRSLTDPVGDLAKFRNRFDQCIKVHPQWFRGFKMWARRNNTLLTPPSKPALIPNTWFQRNNFICLGGWISKHYTALNDSDLESILVAFDRLLQVYEYVVLNKKPAATTRIFTRLTSNENGWQLPSPHRWKTENQGQPNIAFERQYGFGHEEWLLNVRYLVDGYQYGFIRGIQNAKAGTDTYAEVHLYTVKAEQGLNLVYYVGVIRNLQVIKHDTEVQQRIRPIIDRYYNDMLHEIDAINGDRKGVTQHPFQAAVRFHPADLYFLDEPVHQPHFDLDTYKRFQAHEFDGNVAEIFTTPWTETDTIFRAGKASQTSVYDKKNRAASVTVEKVHTEIIEALEVHLKPRFSLVKENLAIDYMRFDGHIADIVTLHADRAITIYEVKTTASGRRNIRDAIAQLLDYAAHAGKLKVRKLVIVSPASLEPTELLFLRTLQNKLDYPLNYLYYDKASNKFIKQE